MHPTLEIYISYINCWIFRTHKSLQLLRPNYTSPVSPSSNGFVSGSSRGAGGRSGTELEEEGRDPEGQHPRHHPNSSLFRPAAANNPSAVDRPESERFIMFRRREPPGVVVTPRKVDFADGGATCCRQRPRPRSSSTARTRGRRGNFQDDSGPGR